METKFNFNSQICTSREQSERLLVLGLKKETADMVHYISASMKEWGILATPWRDDYEGCKFYSPAWSLHRLFQIYTNRVISSSWNMAKFNWDDLIDCIEDSIVKGYFNKEYLV